MTRHREEVINVYLAECIRDRGMRASGEQIEFRGGKRAMPDVLINYMGLRCMIEGKFDDRADVKQEVFENAANRLADGIAHIAIGVVYPARMRVLESQSVKDELATEPLQFYIGTENNFVAAEWQEGNVGEIMSALRRSHEELLANDVVERSVARLRAGMYNLIFVITEIPSVADRHADLLGVYQPSRETSEEDGDE
jgi:hypothetical protein